MIRKFLSFLLCLFAFNAIAQKPDFIRTPNGPNTIVDWNLKAKTLIVPHGATLTLAGAQDTTGHVRLIIAAGDTSLYFYIRGKGWIKTLNNGNIPVGDIQKAFSSVTGYTINWQTDKPDGSTQTYAQIFGNYFNASVWVGSTLAGYLNAGGSPTINYSGGNISTVVFDWGSVQSGYINFSR